MPLPEHEPSLQPLSNEWAPGANAGDFAANIVIAFVVLLVLVIIGFLFCALRLQGRIEDPEKQAGTSMEETTLPTLVFSAGTKLTGAEAECAICLADFVDGDRIWVLPACNHGFHVQCIDRWLAERRSCPTCRVSCRRESWQS